MTLHRLPSGYVFNDDDVSEVVPMAGRVDASSIWVTAQYLAPLEAAAFIEEMSSGSRLVVRFRSRPTEPKTFHSDNADYAALEALLKNGGTWA